MLSVIGKGIISWGDYLGEANPHEPTCGGLCLLGSCFCELKAWVQKNEQVWPLDPGPGESWKGRSQRQLTESKSRPQVTGRYGINIQLLGVTVTVFGSWVMGDVRTRHGSLRGHVSAASSQLAQKEHVCAYACTHVCMCVCVQVGGVCKCTCILRWAVWELFCSCSFSVRAKWLPKVRAPNQRPASFHVDIYVCTSDGYGLKIQVTSAYTTHGKKICNNILKFTSHYQYLK